MNRRVLILAAAALLLPTLGQAKPKNDDSLSSTGYAVATILVKGSPERVRNKLREFDFRRTMSPDVLDMKLVGKTIDTCERIWIKARGLFKSIEYTTKRCEIPGGFHETLLESDDFKSYESFFLIEEVEPGLVRITAKAKVELYVALPQGPMRRFLRRSLRKSLKSFGREFEITG